jgi:hypothetical protein
LDPHFQYGKLRNRPYLNEQHRQQRVEGSRQKLQDFAAQKQWTVFVDEKVMCLSTCSTMGWYSSAAEDFAWSLPRLSYRRNVMKLKYIIGVNYMIGPVWIKFFTGTSGMPGDRPGAAYQVGSCLEQLRGLASNHMLQCLLQAC